jgi:nucleotide-binding universal stress UspA family protein
MNATAPVLIAYDGSDAARRAIHKTAELLGSRRALVLTVWKAGLSVDEDTATRGQARAERIAEEGDELAKSLGLEAEALAVADKGTVAETIIGLARERDVAAIIVGSRGLSGIRARLEGSVSMAVLKGSPFPVLTVHAD